MGASRASQVGIYVGKHFRLFKNERGWKMFIFAAIIAVLISSVISSDIFQYDMATWSGFFAIVSACIWIGVFNSIQTICKERAIIKREYRTGLHITSYVASHVIFQAFICIVEAILVLAISAIFLPYPGYSLLGWVYLEYLITYFIIILSADLLGLAISSIVKTPTTAMTVMPFILIIQLIFSGALFTLSGPIENISSLTISKWGLNATCISADYNELESTEKVKMQKYLNYAAVENELPISEEDIKKLVDENYEKSVLAEYEYTASNLLSQWGIMVIHCAVYILASVIALKFVDKDKR